MTGFPISITYLPGPAPSESLIPAATLSSYFDAAAILEHAKCHATAMIGEAQNTLAAAEHDARQLREDARQQGLAAAAVELERTRRNLIGETVQWLVDEVALEARIADDIDDRLRVLIASVVEPYLRDRDAVDLLLGRVRARLAAGHGSPPLILHVSATSVEQAQIALRGKSHVRVSVDASLGRSEARLESPYAIVQFDLERHLDLLISRLTTRVHEASTDVESN